MFVIINLVFYFGFESSDETDDSVEFDDINQIDIENPDESEHAIINPLNP